MVCGRSTRRNPSLWTIKPGRPGVILQKPGVKPGLWVIKPGRPRVILNKPGVKPIKKTGFLEIPPAHWEIPRPGQTKETYLAYTFAIFRSQPATASRSLRGNFVAASWQSRGSLAGGSREPRGSLAVVSRESRGSLVGDSRQPRGSLVVVAWGQTGV